MKPILLEWGNLMIYSYPLAIGIALGIGHKLSQFNIQRYSLNTHRFNFLFFITMIFSWLGAKLFFVAVSSPDPLSLIGESYFWLGGGFVFYGGLLGGLISYFLLRKWAQIPLNKTFLFIGPLAIGHSIGRLGCLLAGCCYGKICEFPIKIFLHGHYRHPVQLYESCYLAILAFLFQYRLIKKYASNRDIFLYLFLYGAGRFLLEFLRGDDLRGIWSSFSTSQWISIVLIIVGLIGTARIKKSS